MSEPRPSRPSKAVVQRRIEELLRIILDGAEPAWDLCEYVREKEAEEGSAWHLAEGAKPLSYSQIRRYAAKAEKLIDQSCRAQRKKLLRKHLAQRRNLYAKAVSQGDIRAALACLDSEAKLCGLFEEELNRIVERLQREIAEIKANGDRTTPKADSPAAEGRGTTPDPGAGHPDAPPPRSRPVPGVPGPPTGPVAEGAVDELSADDIPPLFGGADDVAV